MVLDKSSYVIINPRNLHEIGKRLSKGHGRIIIGEPGPTSLKSYLARSQNMQPAVTDVYLHLYSNAFIYEDSLCARRGNRKVHGEDWQTGWEKDRQYLLRPARKSFADHASAIFNLALNKLEIEGFEFIINLQSCTGRGICDEDSVALYVPREKSLETPLTVGLAYMVDRMNSTTRRLKSGRALLGEENVRTIVAYMMEDLKTGKVLRHNIDVGLEADACFM